MRSAGLPFALLERLSPDADALEAAIFGDTAHDELSARLEAAFRETRRAMRAVAGDATLREAMTWQNRHAAAVVMRRVHRGRETNRRFGSAERTLTMYVQRYCAKNDTIGFFGGDTRHEGHFVVSDGLMCRAKKQPIASYAQFSTHVGSEEPRRGGR